MGCILRGGIGMRRPRAMVEEVFHVEDERDASVAEYRRARILSQFFERRVEGFHDDVGGALDAVYGEGMPGVGMADHQRGKYRSLVSFRIDAEQLPERFDRHLTPL